MTTQDVESLHCFFVFRWIKLEFGVRGKFRLLILNLNSKTQYQFEISTLPVMGFFELLVMGGGGHNFVVIAPMIMKFGTGVNPDEFYTMVTKAVTLQLLRHYDVIICIKMIVTPNPLTDFTEIWYLEIF